VLLEEAGFMYLIIHILLRFCAAYIQVQEQKHGEATYREERGHVYLVPVSFNINK